jgi:hypothetical protein
MSKTGLRVFSVLVVGSSKGKDEGYDLCSCLKELWPTEKWQINSSLENSNERYSNPGISSCKMQFILFNVLS